MKKISIAVVGVGYWGPNIIRNLLKIKSVKDVYAVDIDREKLKNIFYEYPRVKTESDLGKILNNNQIKAIIVSTPLNTHFKISSGALNANKHVLVEKPFTNKVADAKKLINLAKKKRLVLMSGHTFIYSEPIKKIKEIIDKGRLGQIYYYDSIRINLGLLQKDSNVIWDLAPHDLSILQYLIPYKPISIQATGSAFIGKHEEIAHIYISYEKNISAHIALSWLSPVKIRSIIIGGSKKMIVCNEIEPSEKIKIYDKGIIPSPTDITPFSPAYRSGDVVVPKLEQKEALLNELEHFVHCVLNLNNPASDGMAGLEVVKMIYAIEKALKTKKVVRL